MDFVRHRKSGKVHVVYNCPVPWYRISTLCGHDVTYNCEYVEASEYSGPWCAHCEKIYEKFEEDKLKGKDEVEKTNYKYVSHADVLHSHIVRGEGCVASTYSTFCGLLVYPSLGWSTADHATKKNVLYAARKSTLIRFKN